LARGPEPEIASGRTNWCQAGSVNSSSSAGSLPHVASPTMRPAVFALLAAMGDSTPAATVATTPVVAITWAVRAGMPAADAAVGGPASVGTSDGVTDALAPLLVTDAGGTVSVALPAETEGGRAWLASAVAGATAVTSVTATVAAVAAVGAVASAGSDVDTSSVGVGDGVTVELPPDRDDVFVADSGTGIVVVASATSVTVGVAASRPLASHCHARMGANKSTGHPAAPSRVVVAPGHEAFACADDETVVPLIVTDSPTRATTAFDAAVLPRGETMS
jgi:hypothetical protein